MNQPLADSFAFDDDAIDTAAAAWLCERDEGFAPGRAQEFAAWLASDPRHEEAIVRTENAMALLAELPAVRESLNARLAEPTAIAAHRFPWGEFRPPAWAAGLAAAVALAAGLWWFGSGRSRDSHRYVTAAGRQDEVTLSDGSVLDLNVSSEVNVRLTPSERHIVLAAGEANFAVAHNAARPFTVTAAGITVRAVGTAFSVRVSDADVEVLVAEGKVQITRETAAPSGAASPASPQPTLVAGERALIARQVAAAPGMKIERLSAGALQAAVQWHSQIVTFSDLPLREVVALFNRRNETQLVLTDAVLGARKIGGTFAADQVEAFVRLLVEDGEVVAERRGSREIVLHRAP
jgi:transmembrane sensor